MIEVLKQDFIQTQLFGMTKSDASFLCVQFSIRKPIHTIGLYTVSINHENTFAVFEWPNHRSFPSIAHCSHKTKFIRVFIVAIPSHSYGCYAPRSRQSYAPTTRIYPHSGHICRRAARKVNNYEDSVHATFRMNENVWNFHRDDIEIQKMLEHVLEYAPEQEIRLTDNSVTV